MGCSKGAQGEQDSPLRACSTRCLGNCNRRWCLVALLISLFFGLDSHHGRSRSATMKASRRMLLLFIGGGVPLCQRRFNFDHTAPVSWPIEHQKRGRVSQTYQGGARLLRFPLTPPGKPAEPLLALLIAEKPRRFSWSQEAGAGHRRRTERPAFVHRR
jgi:hypothetical protein